MMDTNNLEVVALIQKWLGERGSCGIDFNT